MLLELVGQLLRLGRRHGNHGIKVCRWHDKRRVAEKAAVAAKYNDQGMAVFTIIKGGLMYEVSLADQKFSFKRN